MPKKKKWKTPYADLIPSLSKEEFGALKADIEDRGVLVPLFVDEDDNILDGHNRYAIDKDAPHAVISGLTPEQKVAFVYRQVGNRRNLSPEQRDELNKSMQRCAFEWYDKDPMFWTQKRIGRELGVGQQRVSEWFKITESGNIKDRPSRGRNPKKRKLKLSYEDKEEIVKRAIKDKEKQKDIADDVKISEGRVSQLVTQAKKIEAVKKDRDKAAKAIIGDCGIVHGDFRDASVSGESIAMILTDPPYDENSVSLYRDLAKFSSNVLLPGGWVLAYTGHVHLPMVIDAFANTEGICYAWTFCCLHSGGDLRFRKYKIHNGWKPIVAAYKPPLKVSWDWFKDVISGGREKDSHEWQQAESEAAYFINELCPKKGIVCDPFTGSGTTLAAAKSLGRRWLGFELEKEHVTTARIRLGSENQNR